MSDVNTNINVEPNNVTPAATQPSVPTVNVEDLLAKVRAEEKGKLYPEIEKLKAEVAAKVERINGLLMSVAEKDEQIKATNKELETTKKELEKQKEEGAKSKVDSKELKELQDKLAQAEKELSDMKAEMAKVEAEKVALQVKAENDAYRAEKVKDLDESVQDLVFGDNKEQIDATYEKAKAAYEKLTNKLGKPNPTSPVKPGMSTHSSVENFNKLTPEEIRELGKDPKKWAEFRAQRGLK